MKKRNLLERTAAPDGTVISLYEHDGGYHICVGPAELMSTRRSASEERLAELACANLRTKRGAQVLVGGLGLGFTLKAVLACLRPDAVVVTAEILTAVIEWNRNPAYPLAGAALADSRVRIVQQDVAEAIRNGPGAFDSIILDVDNGAAALTTGGNARLYEAAGLREIFAALKPEGCAAFWSAAPDAPFGKALAKAGFAVEAHRCRARGSSGAWHAIFVARR